MLIAGGIFLLTAAFAAETLPQIRKTDRSGLEAGGYSDGIRQSPQSFRRAVHNTRANAL